MPKSASIHVDILLLPFAYMFVLSNRADTAIRAVALDRPILPCTDVVMARYGSLAINCHLSLSFKVKAAAEEYP